MSRTWISSAFVLLAFFLSFPAEGAGEQWLQHRAAGMGGRSVPGSSHLSPDVTSQAPAGVALPKFAGADPVFVRWETPMLKSGGVWLALDRARKNGPYNRLFIDSNADGSLADEQPVRTESLGGSYAQFAPAKVLLAGEDGPVAYYLRVQSSVYTVNALFRGAQQTEQVRVYITSAGWYEGLVEIGGHKWRCQLVDFNVNGCFNDTTPYSETMDRIRLGPADDRTGEQLDALFLGKFVEVEGALFSVQAARDGAWVKFTKAENVPMGTIRVPPEITQIDVGAENGLFHRQPVNGAAQIPAGRYRVEKWFIDRKDANGVSWRLEGNTRSSITPFDLAAGGETTLDFGEPVICGLTASGGGGQWGLNQSLQGRSGETITLTRNGNQPPAPKVRVKNADASYDRVFSMQYG